MSVVKGEYGGLLASKDKIPNYLHIAAHNYRHIPAHNYNSVTIMCT